MAGFRAYAHGRPSCHKVSGPKHPRAVAQPQLHHGRFKHVVKLRLGDTLRTPSV